MCQKNVFVDFGDVANKTDGHYVYLNGIAISDR